MSANALTMLQKSGRCLAKNIPLTFSQIKTDGEKKEIAKIHRYALLGNAVSVPVVREVAARIRQTTTLF